MLNMPRLSITENDRRALAKRILAARQKRMMTGAEASDRSGIHPTTLSFIENRKQVPSLAQLVALARLYREPTLNPLGFRTTPRAPARPAVAPVPTGAAS